MQTFNKWLELREGFPANYTPTPRLGTDPLLSALHKINRGQGHQPFDGGFTDSSVIQTRLGLDDQEFNALKQARLLTKDATGVHVDKNKFAQIYQQFTRMTPDRFPTR